MAWDEFTFQQQFSLELGQIHKKPDTRREKPHGVFATLVYGSILSAVRILREIPGLQHAVRTAHSFLGTLSTPVKWLLGIVSLWWAGTIVGLLAGLIFP